MSPSNSANHPPLAGHFVVFQGAPSRRDVQEYLDDSDDEQHDEYLVWDMDTSIATFSYPLAGSVQLCRSSATTAHRTGTNGIALQHRHTLSDARLPSSLQSMVNPNLALCSPAGSRASQMSAGVLPNSHPPFLSSLDPPDKSLSLGRKPSPFLTQSTNSIVTGTMPDEDGKLEIGRRGHLDLDSQTPNCVELANRVAEAEMSKERGSSPQLGQSLSLIMEEDTTGRNSDEETQPAALNPPPSTTFFPTYAAPSLPSPRSYGTFKVPLHPSAPLLSQHDNIPDLLIPKHAHRVDVVAGSSAHDSSAEDQDITWDLTVATTQINDGQMSTCHDPGDISRASHKRLADSTLLHSTFCRGPTYRFFMD